MESQAVDALKQRLHVGGTPLLLLGGGLLDRPFDKLFNAAATEVSESAVHWVDHAVLKRANHVWLKLLQRNSSCVTNDGKGIKGKDSKTVFNLEL